ncbi:MAG TPA: BON domain-containing protein [Armatimonadota bacterium]|nr:BON domain-containing protein [Armatimonadota bacterium]HPP73948.1 BON domain-containing protein [Armatimonadota bacterium]
MAFQDEALAQMVRHAITQDKRIGGQPIMVRAANGEIALKGRVDTAEQRELALLVAQGIPGVRHVNIDELIIKEGGESE